MVSVRISLRLFINRKVICGGEGGGGSNGQWSVVHPVTIRLGTGIHNLHTSAQRDLAAGPSRLDSRSVSADGPAVRPRRGQSRPVSGDHGRTVSRRKIIPNNKQNTSSVSLQVERLKLM